jgi:phosphoribosylaminoimidazole-succinocarboxamide synthase
MFRRICLKLLRRGKVKDIYESDNGHLLLHFSDRISAFDVKMATLVPHKGEILCSFAKFWFEFLDFPNHMLAVPKKDMMEVKKLRIIPLEFVVRGYLYGSLFERFTNSENTGGLFDESFRPLKAAKLPHPILDPSTKSDLHDVPITKSKILESGILSTEEYEFLEQVSISLYNKMNAVAEKAKFIIADVKFEFGRDSDNRIILADSIGPDEFRLWLKSSYFPGTDQTSYDKQLLRDWLKKSGLLQQILDKNMKQESLVIPSEITYELTKRYNFAFKEISGQAH